MARRGISVATEALVRQRAGERCEYCRSAEDFSPDTFSIEHITPRALGGSSEADNLAFSCQGCNGVKGVRVEAFDAATSAFVPLFHPRRAMTVGTIIFVGVQIRFRSRVFPPSVERLSRFCSSIAEESLICGAC